MYDSLKQLLIPLGAALESVKRVQLYDITGFRELTESLSGRRGSPFPSIAQPSSEQLVFGQLTKFIRDRAPGTQDH